MFPNPIATRWGRLLTFALLYITEGIPLGFTATAMTVQMRRGGMSTEAIGLFVGSLYLPWAWKWAAGPVVDLVYSNRFGRRRAWIMSTQILMVLTLMACLPFDLVAEIELVTLMLFVHNSCCAVQDVAIDALACETLRDDERGLGNGLMFAGQALGQTIGGAGVLMMSSFLASESVGMQPEAAFSMTYWFVAACLLLITFGVAWPIREQPLPRVTSEDSPLSTIISQLKSYVVTAGKSFVGSQTAFIGLLIAGLPAGAAALGLALQSNVAVELGFDDEDVAELAMYSTLIQAAGCFLGGIVSDRLGRRLALAIFLVACSVPTFWLAQEMHRHGWIMPRPPVTKTTEVAPSDAPAQQAAAEPKPLEIKPAIEPQQAPPELVRQFWICCLVYAAAYGLMTGSQIPVFMEITNKAVAATQFTAYMALHNLVTSYTAAWQGFSAGALGYPTTLMIDASVGLVGIGLLPFLVLTPRTPAEIAIERDADLGHPSA